MLVPRRGLVLVCYLLQSCRQENLAVFELLNSAIVADAKHSHAQPWQSCCLAGADSQLYGSVGVFLEGFGHSKAYAHALLRR